MSRVTEIGVEDVEDRAPQGGGRDATWCDGASLDLLARETGQPAGRVAAWREEFLAAGREGLKSRPVAVEDVALGEAQRKVGELAMEVDILRALLERKGEPSVAEALEVSEQLPHHCKWCVGWRACPVWRRARRAAGGAPRSRPGGDPVRSGR